MSEYIKQEDALDAVLFALVGTGHQSKAIYAIRDIPTTDVVEVRHGEWRKVNDKYPRYVCTVCNHLFNNKNYNYCPCCGAKMDGERSENGKS